MATEIYINAGGAELKIAGEVADSHAFALWEKILTRIESGRNRVGSGSGFQAELAEQVIEQIEGQQTLPELKRERSCFHTAPCYCPDRV